MYTPEDLKEFTEHLPTEMTDEFLDAFRAWYDKQDDGTSPLEFFRSTDQAEDLTELSGDRLTYGGRNILKSAFDRKGMVSNRDAEPKRGEDQDGPFDITSLIDRIGLPFKRDIDIKPSKSGQKKSGEKDHEKKK